MSTDLTFILIESFDFVSSDSGIMNFDFAQLWKSKRALRERLAARPITEKLRMLDAMRERAVSISPPKPAQLATMHEQPPG